MERFERIEVTENYILEYDREDRVILIHVTSKLLRLKLRTPMLYTHDGTLWIKTSGGKSLNSTEVQATLKISNETMQKVRQLLAKP